MKERILNIKTFQKLTWENEILAKKFKMVARIGMVFAIPTFLLTIANWIIGYETYPILVILLAIISLYWKIVNKLVVHDSKNLYKMVNSGCNCTTLWLVVACGSQEEK